VLDGISHKPGEDSDEEVVYDKREGFEIAHPKDGCAMPAKFLFTVDNTVVSESDLRESLAGWLTARGNPLFAKPMANRMWSYCFGKGIIDPVDDIRASNPPSNPALLDALAKDFLDHDYDLKHLIRTTSNWRRSTRWRRTCPTPPLRMGAFSISSTVRNAKPVVSVNAAAMCRWRRR